jgi:hypothetical protein
MSRKLLTAIVTFLMVLSVGTLFADNDSAAFKANETKIDTVIATVVKNKLVGVKSIEFDDGVWEVKTLVKNIESTYNYNSSTGALNLVKKEPENDLPPPSDLTSLQNAINAVKKQPYDVFSIDYEGSYWEVKAFDSKGLEYVILVDKESSAILNTSLDD